MTWGYLPPAVSDLFLPAVVARLLRGDQTTLETEICSRLGCRAAATGSSWVLILRQLLHEVAATRPGRTEVILPSYSCNEFTKAVLLAGLRPRYVDLRHDLASDAEAIESAVTAHTLAVFSINNIGRASDNAAIRALCDRHGIYCIEDATYTFLGVSDADQRPFGTYGHFAVLNFSEGKIIPVGGGAVLTNDVAGIGVIEKVRDHIASRPAASSWRELVGLLVYRAGSSRLGYSAYRVLRERGGGDLKQRLSMEPTRANEVGNDLERDSSGDIVLRPERIAKLADGAALRPLGRPKQLCGSEIIRRADTLRDRRHARYQALRRALERATTAHILELPTEGMPIKVPFVITTDVSAAEQRRLDRLGVARGYSTAYPTYGTAASPHSNRFFERLYTLPVHRYVSDRVVLAIVEALVVAGQRAGAFHRGDDGGRKPTELPATGVVDIRRS